MPSSEQPAATPRAALDEKDYAILRLLEHDAKLSVREIATRVHLSATPVHERIKRLESSGVIRQYAALLDGRQLNRQLIVWCLVSLKQHDAETAADFISGVTQFKEVLECYNIAGEYDFMLKIVSESVETYHHFFINYLGGVKGIGKAQSVFVMDVIKNTHALL